MLTHVQTLLRQAAEAHWALLQDLLPADLADSARRYGAFCKPGGVESAALLLRLLLAYTSQRSLRTVAAWAAQQALADVSHVALDKRFRRCAPWLAFLIGQQLAGGDAAFPRGQALRVRVLDATTAERPGATGTDWRLHVGLDLRTGMIDHLSVTTAAVGERFANLPVAPGDVALADRAYGSRAGIAALVARHAHPLVRLNWRTCPLQTPQGEALDLDACGQRVPPGTIEEWAVQTAPTQTAPAIPGRLIMVALPPDQAEGARTRLRKTARAKRSKGKGGRKKATASPAALRMAGYVVLFTTVPPAVLSRHAAAALYRGRWQIELAFKRLKQVLHLADIPAKTDALCLTYLLTRLLLALLIDQILRATGGFSPLSPGGRPVSRYRLLQALAEAITGLLLLPPGLEQWLQGDADPLRDALADSPRRKRDPQLLQLIPLLDHMEALALG